MNLFKNENNRLTYPTFQSLFRGMATSVCLDPRIKAGSKWSTFAPNTYEDNLLTANEIQIIFYRAFDANVDGVISQKEWTKLFKKTDKNRNKSLDEKEFAALDMKEACFEVAVKKY